MTTRFFPIWRGFQLFILASLCSFSWSQDLARVQTLIETWRTSLMPDTFDTVLISVTQTNFPSGDVWSIEQFFDFRRDVAYSTAEDSGASGSNAVTFKDGKLEANMILDPSASVSAEQLRDKSSGLFTWFSTQLEEFRIFIPEDYEIVSYEGLVQYGDLVRGEQVTLSFQDVKAKNQQVERSFIFSETGELVATFEKSQDRLLLSVLEIFGFGDYVRVKATAYSSDGQSAAKIYELREDYQFNKAIDATPFASN